jgi:hypothetical protein
MLLVRVSDLKLRRVGVNPGRLAGFDRNGLGRARQDRLGQVRWDGLGRVRIERIRLQSILGPVVDPEFHLGLDTITYKN